MLQIIMLHVFIILDDKKNINLYSYFYQINPIRGTTQYRIILIK